ncbi:MAG: DUF1800 domain-containing protein [Blastocatellia bacterium]|nr:DUF1800 domain-containing protein [Blastocatellia bacterium]
MQRRGFLKMAGLGMAGVLTAACDGTSHWKAWFGQGQGNLPMADWQGTEAERQAAHVLNRMTYGPRPGDVETLVRQGWKDFLENQLQPEAIPDFQASLLVRRISTLSLRAPELFDFPAEEILTELRQATLLRALYSERQLLEVMVEFWGDHFNIFAGKGDCAWLKVTDDRDVLRTHALGNFRRLLRAVATSPAMLVYLDGTANVRGNPNENYARELMELHTLGVNGGYSQTDVKELARALTGWQVANRFRRGTVSPDESRHDGSPVVVLGQEVTGTAEAELDRVLDILCTHPATAHFLAFKLCRRFVSDQPSAALVQQVATRFIQTGGEIKPVLRILFHSEEFQSAPPKFKRPYRFAVSALRALGARCDGRQPLQEQFRDMGQLPFHWPTPNGYPDVAEAWAAHVLPRWNFACDLAAGRIQGTRIETAGIVSAGEKFAETLLQRRLAPHEQEAFALVTSEAERIALLLCLPDFQFG